MRLKGKRAVFRQILPGDPLEAQICHFELANHQFEAKMLHFEAKMKHFEAKRKKEGLWNPSKEISPPLALKYTYEEKGLGFRV